MVLYFSGETGGNNKITHLYEPEGILLAGIMLSFVALKQRNTGKRRFQKVLKQRKRKLHNNEGV